MFAFVLLELVELESGLPPLVVWRFLERAATPKIVARMLERVPCSKCRSAVQCSTSTENAPKPLEKAPKHVHVPVN